MTSCNTLYSKLSLFEGFHECGQTVDTIGVLHLKRTTVDQEILANDMLGLLLLRHTKVVELECLCPI